MEMMESGHAGSERMYTCNTGYPCVCVCDEFSGQASLQIPDEG